MNLLEVLGQRLTYFPDCFDFTLAVINDGKYEVIKFTLTANDNSPMALQVRDWLQEVGPVEFENWEPPVIPDGIIKAEAAKRIRLIGHDDYLARKQATGKPIPPEVEAEAARIRARSNEIEKLSDREKFQYWDDKLWQDPS